MQLLVCVDPSDPKKRTREDLKLALDTLTAVEQLANVVLSLNCSEAYVINMDMFIGTYVGPTSLS